MVTAIQQWRTSGKRVRAAVLPSRQERNLGYSMYIGPVICGGWSRSVGNPPHLSVAAKLGRAGVFFSKHPLRNLKRRLGCGFAATGVRAPGSKSGRPHRRFRENLNFTIPPEGVRRAGAEFEVGSSAGRVFVECLN